ncbi:alpha/beta hydrolase [Pseudonocardia eucalypti]|uniref:Alpha/beta hydrolase n=1 Tax=Pseudonocardia eucalypti TaxID=648755 RepID=A0ABP9PWS5_9PSEU|nr:pimeloyl-ACP methyl ester carboxylesterase [Pseudonocardia eucalypti]
MNSSAPIVLLHGFWHGSWCWSPLVEELAVRGIGSVAVDMEGHGLNGGWPGERWARPFDAGAYSSAPSPSASVTASSAAARLGAQLRRIGGGRPCLVVAHSMGGTVATLLAEREPELVAGVVYLAAFAPTGGRAAVDYIGVEENQGEMVGALLVADPAAVGALRMDPADAARHAAIREAFYGDVEPGLANAAISLLTPDAPAGIPGEPITPTPERFGRVPHTYVVCSQDNALRPALQRRFIREIDALSAAPTEVVELDASHSPFFSQPDKLAEAVAAAHRAAVTR